jgi:biotin synthase
MNKGENLFTKLDTLLSLDDASFDENIRKPALQILREQHAGEVIISGLLGISNNCRNNCTYCGLRRDRNIKRFRLEYSEIKKVTGTLKELGLGRIFYISGERNRKKLDEYLRIIEYAKSQELEVNLAAGTFTEADFVRMKNAGLDMYTLKFETSNDRIFSACKPDIPLAKRLESIESVKAAGLKLGSGNIIGLENQSLKDIIEDIRIMARLEIDWAPIVPYMPAVDTPMAETTGPGDIELTLRVLSILRLLLPNARITASQPRAGSNLGFADPEGNRRALLHGANALFIECTPLLQAEQFEITTARKLPRLEEVQQLLEGLDLQAV